jgi:hypothetical protein
MCLALSVGSNTFEMRAHHGLLSTLFPWLVQASLRDLMWKHTNGPGVMAWAGRAVNNNRRGSEIKNSCCHCVCSKIVSICNVAGAIVPIVRLLNSYFVEQLVFRF